MSELKPVTRKEAYWAAMADDTITPPEPQTTEECILAAMSGNYPTQDIKPQTREQGLMKKAVDATQKAMVQNVEFAEISGAMATDASDFAAYITELVIPEGVTGLTSANYNGDGYDIFTGFTNLKKITLPGSMTTIPSQVLGYACGSTTPLNKTLKEIVISEGTTVIDVCAFEEMWAVESITLPQSLTTIKQGALGDTAIKELYIPKNVSYIGYCGDSLMKFDVDLANQHFSSLDGVLFNKDKTTILQYPKARPNTEYVIPSTVSDIAERCFIYAKHLSVVTIPNSVTEISSGAFSNCSNLSAVNLPTTLVEIGESAFSSCENLSNINLPEGVIKIGSNAFNMCESFTEISLPDSVIELESSAFSRCTNLSSIHLSNNLTKIGNNAFQVCPSLTEITIPASVTEIGTNAFIKTSALAKITINKPENSISGAPWGAPDTCEIIWNG